jgi:hypothetical protein
MWCVVMDSPSAGCGGATMPMTDVVAKKGTKNQLTHARRVWLVLHCKWCCALHYIEL